MRNDESGTRIVELAVPGAVWFEALDPYASAMEGELGLTELRHKRFIRVVGKGTQRVYANVPHTIALELAEYLHDHGDMLLGQQFGDEDKSTRDALRRCVTLAAAIRELVTQGDRQAIGDATSAVLGERS